MSSTTSRTSSAPRPAASYAPALANFLTQTPGLNALVKAVGGIAKQRRMPPFAWQSFRQWFAAHTPKNPGGPPVILFPDTFNNFFRPQTAINAVKVLEAFGWNIMIPQRVLCCGRPLYDWGMLDEAKAFLAVAEKVAESLKAAARPAPKIIFE